MKPILTLALLLSLAAFARGATPVYPAGTNVNNTFYLTNTFKKGIYVPNGGGTNSPIFSLADDPTHFFYWLDSTAEWRFTDVLNGSFLGPLTGLASANLALTGGTVSGPVLSTSSTTNSPGNSEFVTGLWVRNLFNVGADYYVSTNQDNVATNTGSGQPIVKFQSTIPGTNQLVYTTGDFLTNGGYLSGVITTNTFQQLGGSVAVHRILAYTGGTGSPTLSVHPELYYSYDRTNWQGDFAGSSTLIVNGITNAYDWAINIPTLSSTNATGFWLQSRLKCDSVTGNGTRTFRLFAGTNAISGPNDASHNTMQSPTANQGNAFLNANQTFNGTNTFTAPITGRLLALTNSALQTVNFALPWGSFQTNAAFAWLGFINIVPNEYNTSVVFVTNSTGAAFDFTVPANCHAVGTLNVTNVTECCFTAWGNAWTNLLSLPLW